MKWHCVLRQGSPFAQTGRARYVAMSLSVYVILCSYFHVMLILFADTSQSIAAKTRALTQKGAVRVDMVWLRVCDT